MDALHGVGNSVRITYSILSSARAGTHSGPQRATAATGVAAVTLALSITHRGTHGEESQRTVSIGDVGPWRSAAEE